MKLQIKFIILLTFLLLISQVFAEDEVYLDLSIPDIQRINTGQLQFENKKLNMEENEDYLKPSFQTMKKMFDEDFYKPKTVSSKKEKKFGKNTIGAKYDTTLKSESVNQSRTIYAKRDITEKMSIDASYKNDSNEENSNDNELEENIKEKPFLIFPTKILNFHRHSYKGI